MKTKSTPELFAIVRGGLEWIRQENEFEKASDALAELESRLREREVAETCPTAEEFGFCSVCGLGRIGDKP